MLKAHPDDLSLIILIICRDPVFLDKAAYTGTQSQHFNITLLGGGHDSSQSSKEGVRPEGRELFSSVGEWTFAGEEREGTEG